MSMGEIVLELIPSPRNTRNSEGAFVQLNDGRLMMAYTRFGADGGDNGTAIIAAKFSTDQGKTWSEREFGLVRNEAKMNVMSVSLLRLQDGRVAMFYLRKEGWHDTRLYMRTSSDEAQSWSPPRLCIPAPGYFVVNNDRVIQMENGRLVVPAAYHRMKGPSTSHWDDFDLRGITMFFMSDDAGETWQESDDWWGLPKPNKWGMQEPGVVQLSSGRLFAWARTDVGFQWGMYSSNLGRNWTEPYQTPYQSPCSSLSIKRVPNSKLLLSVWNDHSGKLAPVDPNAPLGWDRWPLAMSVTRSEKNPYENMKIIDDDPDRGFAYTAIHFTEDDHVLLAYSAGSKESLNQLGTLRVRRIALSAFGLSE